MDHADPTGGIYLARQRRDYDYYFLILINWLKLFNSLCCILMYLLTTTLIGQNCVQV